MFQRISYGSNQSALGMGLLVKWVPVHEHFTLQLQLIVSCSSLVDVLVAKGSEFLKYIFLRLQFVLYYLKNNAYLILTMKLDLRLGDFWVLDTGKNLFFNILIMA